MLLSNAINSMSSRDYSFIAPCVSAGVCTQEIGNAYSGFTKDHHTPCNESAMHDQNSFVIRSEYSEKKRLNDSSEETRQRHRKRYSLLTEAEERIVAQEP
jgi:hypothetical protein